jgi:hypothetical protein
MKHQMAGCLNDEMAKMWKKTVMAYFKDLFQHLLGRNLENHENLKSE